MADPPRYDAEYWRRIKDVRPTLITTCPCLVFTNQTQPDEIRQLLGQADVENVMADPPMYDAEHYRRIKDTRNLRELFKGRFTNNESFALMRHFGWDRDRAVGHVLHSQPGEIRQLLGQADVEDRIAVVTQDNVLRDLARRNDVEPEIRQFACADCNKMWWRRVPTRKPVARCFGCHRKFDPIPRDEEWGLAEFECQCGSIFKGIGAMGRTTCMCYRCGTMNLPARILPPLNTNESRQRSRHRHSCNAPNCYNRQGPIDPNMICIHPRSNPAMVLVASLPHVSTGSTVNTFLNQDDIIPPYEPSLNDIEEVRDEDEDD